MTLGEFINLSANAPAVVGGTVLGGLLVLEVIGLLIGLSASHAVDDYIGDVVPDTHVDVPDAHFEVPDGHFDAHVDHAHADVDHDLGGFASALSWLGLGRVPFMVWLSSHLVYVICGTLLMNHAWLKFLGTPKWWITYPVVQAGAFALSHFTSRWLGRVFPKEHTTHVTLDSLLGRRAEITSGVATLSLSAEATVVDKHGEVHLISVRPMEDRPIPPNSPVILIDRKEGEHFFRVIPYQNTTT